jgi:hypothetical protein
MFDKVRKQTIGNKEYSFKMTNKTIRKIDEKYENYGSILYGLMEGKQFYTNALKLVSMSCIEKEWDIEELEDAMTGQQYQEITVLAVDLYFDYMGINEETEEEQTEKEEDKTEKN